MAHQGSPSYDDLEPEGEEVQMPNDFEDTDEFDDEPGLGFGDQLGEYQFQTREAYDEFDLDPEDDEFLPRRRNKRDRRHARADLAAQTGSRSPRFFKTNDNGHRSNAPQQPHRQPRRSEAEYWTGWDTELFEDEAGVENIEAWSAALVEDYELMELLATAAATTRRSAEADGLVAAMVPLALRLAPQAYRALWPALPALIRGAVGVARTVRQRRNSRRLMEMLPPILENTVAQLARYASSGRPISQRLTAKILAGETAAALRGPSHRQALSSQPGAGHRRSRRNERRWGDDDDDL